MEQGTKAVLFSDKAASFPRAHFGGRLTRANASASVPSSCNATPFDPTREPKAASGFSLRVSAASDQPAPFAEFTVLDRH